VFRNVNPAIKTSIESSSNGGKKTPKKRRGKRNKETHRARARVNLRENRVALLRRRRARGKSLLGISMSISGSPNNDVSI
jgi:hypothetical protein